MRLRAVLSLAALPLAVGLLAGCSDDSDPNGYDRTDWDAEAIAELDEIAAKVTASDVGCNDYGPDGFVLMRESFKAVDQPIPAASTSCASDDDENLTFEAFENPKAKERFIEAKATLLCERLRPLDEGVEFVGLPYLDGGEWMVSPDSAAMRDRLQPIVGGEPKNMCEGGA